MSAAAALARARAAGVGLRLGPGGRVVVGARPSAVPPDLLAELRGHRAEIAALLAAEPDDVAALAGLLDLFPGATVDELRLAGPFDRPDLQRAFPDARVVPPGDETPADPEVEPWTWSLPLPPRRARPREPRPGPEPSPGPACRFCSGPVDLRETPADPDGGFSHLSCWAEAGHPEVGWSAALGPPPQRVAAPVPEAADLCKHCGQPVDWRADGVPFGDGSCAHRACYEREG